MKHFILLSLGLMISALAHSQSLINDKELNLYISGGMKLLTPKYFGHAANISPNSVPTIGGGALWQKNKFQFGGEFNYTDGKKNTPEFGTIFTGINFNLIAAYNYNLTEKIRIGIQSGFGYSLHHLSLTDNNFVGTPKLNTAIYHNMIYTVPLALTVQRININKTFVGIKAGYNFNAMPNEWRYIEGSTTEISTTGTDGFFIQLLFGGVFNRKGPSL
jgi:hypothetical protein